MAHQSKMAAEGADEDDQYLELVWANLGCGLTMISGFCTAINPIDFTLWTTIVLIFGIFLGKSDFTEKLYRAYLKNVHLTCRNHVLHVLELPF